MQARSGLKAQVEFFYDLQRLRIQTSGRITRALEHDDACLTDGQRKFFDLSTKTMHDLERAALNAVKKEVRKSSIFPWLEAVKGVGPTLAGVLISQFDINLAVRPSQFWSFAGLGVVNGKSPRPKKGEKLKYNSWLRSKMHVLGECLLKCGSPDYRPIYDGMKHRRQHMLVDCMACAKSRETPASAERAIDGESPEPSERASPQEAPKVRERVDEPEPTTPRERAGHGESPMPPERANEPEAPSGEKRAMATEPSSVDERASRSETPEPGERAIPGETPTPKKRAKKLCKNCGGTGRGMWGKSDGHRHNDAMRYMVKMFLLDFWTAWRKAEGLPVVPSYAEDKLNRRHRDDGLEGAAA
jgi:hypothetical protein